MVAWVATRCIDSHGPVIFSDVLSHISPLVDSLAHGCIAFDAIMTYLIEISLGICCTARHHSLVLAGLPSRMLLVYYNGTGGKVVNVHVEPCAATGLGLPCSNPKGRCAGLPWAADVVDDLYQRIEMQ